MHDIKLIRETPDVFDAAMARRGVDTRAADVLAIDAARRAKIQASEEAKAEQNAASKQVGAAKASGDEAEFERLRALVGAKKEDVARLNDEAKDLDGELTNLLMSLPNLLDASVPDGADEDDNVEIKSWGTPRETDFAALEHYDIPAIAAGLDFELAAKLSGSRFMVLSGAVARLHRALAQFMVNHHVDTNGLSETWTPILVREDMMYGTGQLPKFGGDSYKTTNGWWLVPTAEVTLTNTVNGQTVDAASLPRRLVAHTQCFRSEAGSAGRDTSGVLRQHQFEKVEMVSITHPDNSMTEHDRMTACAEGVLEALGLPYRTVVLCTGDIGFGAIKTNDIEVWLPGQNAFREISSVSVCGDFQARRMNARFKPEDGGKPQFVHTLNGSGLAVGRALIAVVENGQQADGSVVIPEVLRPFMGGNSMIQADGTLA